MALVPTTAKWIIFYDDGSSFSSLDGDPWEAPRTGVICIAVAHISCGNYILAEQNFYCWHFEDSEWVPHDQNGLWQYLQKPGPYKVTLQGYWINRERYAAMRSAAGKDERLPSRTANPPRQPEGEDFP